MGQADQPLSGRPPQGAAKLLLNPAQPHQHQHQHALPHATWQRTTSQPAAPPTLPPVRLLSCRFHSACCCAHPHCSAKQHKMALRNKLMVINAGSSSLKFKLFQMGQAGEGGALSAIASGVCERVGDPSASFLRVSRCCRSSQRRCHCTSTACPLLAASLPTFELPACLHGLPSCLPPVALRPCFTVAAA